MSMTKTHAEIQKAYEKRSGYAARKKYEKKVVKILVRLNPDKDQDIIEKLDMSQPLSPQIKNLLRDK